MALDGDLPRATGDRVTATSPRSSRKGGPRQTDELWEYGFPRRCCGGFAADVRSLSEAHHGVATAPPDCVLSDFTRKADVSNPLAEQEQLTLTDLTPGR